MAKPYTPEQKKLIHVTWVSGYSFLGSAATFLASMLFAPSPDLSHDPPIISPILMMFGQISTAFLIIGCVAYATKLTEEKKTLSSIGFTLMSVVQAILFILYVFSYSGEEKIAEAYRTFSASLYVLIPSLLLIAIFSEFPRWIRIFTVVSCLPYVVENVIYAAMGKFSEILVIIDGIGNTVFNLMVACWGFFILRRLRTELNHLSVGSQPPHEVSKPVGQEL